MTAHYDTIVIGAGSMGSATCYYLAKAGQKVLGIEQFSPPHERGSHAGQSRIIRKAYFEHPDYVPLLERAYKNWEALESETGSQLYHPTGIVYFGMPDNENIEGIRRSAALHDIHIENWARDKAFKKYPQFEIPHEFDIIFEPAAGMVMPATTIETYVRTAELLGAVILKDTAVLKWMQEAKKIRVITAAADYTADKLVITAGAWSSRMIPDLKIPLKVTRQLLAWVFPEDPAAFALGNFPCWFVEDPALGAFYGFPLLPRTKGPIGLKLAHHHPGVPSGPDEVDGRIPASEEKKLRQFLKKYIPSAGQQVIQTKQCLYTYSPDSHFIIDYLPGFDKKVAIACGFSGHGFKFVPVVGEVLAEMVVRGSADLDLRFLRAGRFG